MSLRAVPAPELLFDDHETHAERVMTSRLADLGLRRLSTLLVCRPVMSSVAHRSVASRIEVERVREPGPRSYVLVETLESRTTGTRRTEYTVATTAAPGASHETAYVSASAADALAALEFPATGTASNASVLRLLEAVAVLDPKTVDEVRCAGAVGDPGSDALRRPLTATARGVRAALVVAADLASGVPVEWVLRGARTRS